MTVSTIKDKIKRKVYDTNTISFYEDLVEAFNLDDQDPIVPKMYSLAWANGHAYGCNEVLVHFEALVKIFKNGVEDVEN